MLMHLRVEVTEHIYISSSMRTLHPNGIVDLKIIFCQILHTKIRKVIVVLHIKGAGKGACMDRHTSAACIPI